jgi:soluble lytic murein transglycosylase-like protein
MQRCFYVFLLTVGLLSMSLSPLVAETAADAASPASKPAATAARVVSVVRANPRTGRLVRTFIAVSSVVTGKPVQHDAKVVATSSPVASVIEGFIEEASRAYDVPSELVHSVIQVESSYNPYAVSYKGAQGLMQLMPATAKRFGVTNPFDAKQNIEGGVKYLKFLQDTFKDDRLAIAAYNAGERAVARYNNVPPYAETVAYVARVGKRYEKARRDSESRKQVLAKVAKPAESPPAEPQYRPLEQYVDAEGRLHLVTR